MGEPVINQPMRPPNWAQPAGFGGPGPAEEWMSLPQIPANCPPGLEYLAAIDQLLVHQKLEVLEVITGFETENKYFIRNSLGQNIFYAMEESDCCARNCCGPLRSFDMKILDNYQNEVIHIYRPLACGTCCFPCCLQTMEVYSPPGNLLGTIEQNWSCYPKFSIKSAYRETLLKIEGPFCTVSCGGDVDFQVLTSDGSRQVGRISKQWTDLAREWFTDADNFGITFPMDLDVKTKALMLGACFLIDMMYFENNQQRR